MSFAACFTLCFLCLLLSIVAAQSTTNITLGSSLTAGDESSWVSPSGDFAFGFQLVGTGSGYLLCIWFNKIPEKTITWSAKRDELAQHGSKLQLTSDGRLVMADTGGSEMWSASVNGVAFATMLDSGNLVLKDENSVIIWQSFNTPTDTILPTQVLNKDDALISRLSDTNYSRGRFQLTMQRDGNLVFYLLNWPEDLIQYSFYEATSTVGSGYQLVFNQSGQLYIAAKNGSVVVQVLSYRKSTEDVYHRAILEFDGVLRMYVYPRSNSTNLPRKWTMQDFRPENICNHAFNTGGGICGFYSLCQLGDDSYKRPRCECPPSYSFLDQTDRMKGCKPEFAPQSCLEKSHQFQLIKMPGIDFPGSDLNTFQGLSEDSCRESCLSDCFCAAVTIGERCWKKSFPFSNGQFVEVNLDGSIIIPNTFIKVPIGNSSTTEPIIQPIGGRGHNYKDMGRQNVIMIESVFLGGSVLLNIFFLTSAVFTLTFCTYKRSKANIPREDQDIAGTNMRSFSYRELEEATDGFKEVLGQGAFATVYKGFLDSLEGNFIAVKKLNEMAKNNQREFESEVKAIARTCHRNLVQLIGFCNEGQHRLLVYEYMPNGSLADILLQGQRPNLSRRIKFALETARGLNYLHEECSIQIIHCDIKLQNVLLDDSFTARISDFGLAKLLKKDQAHTITGIRGTKGYVAPEWFKSVPVTTKVDVYSYGILLLELIFCRRCFEAKMEDESRMVLAEWAYDCYHGGRINELVEGDDEASSNIEGIMKSLKIALWCIQEDPSLRPSMNKVVQMIKEALDETIIGYGHSSTSLRIDDF